MLVDELRHSFCVQRLRDLLCLGYLLYHKGLLALDNLVHSEHLKVMKQRQADHLVLDLFLVQLDLVFKVDYMTRQRLRLLVFSLFLIDVVKLVSLV